MKTQFKYVVKGMRSFWDAPGSGEYWMAPGQGTTTVLSNAALYASARAAWRAASEGGCLPVSEMKAFVAVIRVKKIMTPIFVEAPLKKKAKKS